MVEFFSFQYQLQTQFCVCTVVFFRCKRTPLPSTLTFHVKRNQPRSAWASLCPSLLPLSWPWCCPRPRPAFTVIPSLSLECSSPALYTLALCLLVLAEATSSERHFLTTQPKVEPPTPFSMYYLEYIYHTQKLPFLSALLPRQ